jgi:hypothetical protein
MESGFIVYLNQLKRKQERSKKQANVAVCQAIADARVENKAALVKRTSLY